MNQLNSDTVGEFFMSASGDIYKQTSYCKSPTVCIENVMTGEVQNHAIDCLNIKTMELEQVLELRTATLVDVITRLGNFSMSLVEKVEK